MVWMEGCSRLTPNIKFYSHLINNMQQIVESVCAVVVGLRLRNFEDLLFRTLERRVRVQRMTSFLIGKGKGLTQGCKRRREEIAIKSAHRL